MERSETSRYIIILYILLCITGAMFLINLGDKGLWSAQEARNALAARDMINGSLENWIMPEIALERSTQKPVFFYWLVSVSCVVGGSVSEFCVRFPAAVSGLLCAVYLFFVGKRLMSTKIGLLAAIVMATCGKFISLSRTSRIDIFLALCMTVILCEFLFFHFDKKRFHLLVAYFFAALAVLSKGPVGIVLPFGVLFVFCLTIRQPKHFFSFISVPAAVLFLVLVIPYYIVASKVTGGEFFYDFIIKHNIERFTGMSGTFGDRKPIWYYIPNFLAGALPWTVFIPLLFAYYKISFTGSEWIRVLRRHDESGEAEQSSGNTHIYTFMMLSFVLIFCFFSLSSFKRGDYILPVYPFFAFLLAGCIADERFLRTYIQWFKAVLGILMVCFVCMLVLIILSISVNIPDFLFSIGLIDKYFNNNDRVTIEAIWLFARKNTVLLLVIFGMFTGLLWHVARTGSKQIKKITVLVISIILALYYFYFARIEPFIDRFCTMEPFAKTVNEAVGDESLIIYHFWNHNLAYYLDRELISIYFDHELQETAAASDQVFFVVEQKWFDRLPDDFRAACTVLATTPEYHRKQILVVGCTEFSKK